MKYELIDKIFVVGGLIVTIIAWLISQPIHFVVGLLIIASWFRDFRIHKKMEDGDEL